MKKVAVVSGKGGVGKTTIAVSMTVSMAKRGIRVGLLDVDLTGSSVPDVLGYRELGVTSNDTLVPAESMGVKYVSLGLIVGLNPVLWEPGNLKSAIRQLVERVEWGDIEYLVCDFPPGFGPEVLEALPIMDVALVVTTPSALSRSKVKRMIEALREYGVPIAGVIVNMDSVVCPRCGSTVPVFQDDSSFEEEGIPTIARIPLRQEYSVSKIVHDFPIDRVLVAIENPVKLEKRRVSVIKRLALKLILGGVRGLRKEDS